MSFVKLVFVGGFLGAGKTTLLWESAKRLIAQGKHVGLVTNDQAPDLVDTSLLLKQGLNVQEVAGSCFCCNFQGLINAAERLRHDMKADILIAEPVGSCTDLSATILQPLKDRYKNRFSCSPLSVLADPFRLKDVLTGKNGSMHPSAAYIVRKQLEEADWIVINKVDLLSSAERQEIKQLIESKLPGRTSKWLSAQKGEGVDDWLSSVLQETRAGGRVVEIDYDRYAEGEAVLGWLNAAIRLSSSENAPFDGQAFCMSLLEELQQVFKAKTAQVGHVKLVLSTNGGQIIGNLTRTDEQISIRGELPSPVTYADLVVNARVEMSPQELEQVVREHLQLAATPASVEIREIRSLSPGRPEPTFRYKNVV